MVLILDIARGLAALGVFLFHISPMIEKAAPFFLPIAIHGNFGVPIFFVISGYVITASANAVLSKDASPFDFLRRRFLRIYPPFWASIVVVLAAPYLIESVSYLKTGHYVYPDALWRTMSGSDWLGLVTLYKVFLSTGDLQKEFNVVNSVYWTLAIEFQFYLVVFVGLFLKKKFGVFLVCVTIVSGLVSSLNYNVNLGLFIHYWWMFAFGVMLFYLHKNDVSLARYARHKAAAFSFLLTSIILCLLLTLIYRGQLIPLLNSLVGNAGLGVSFLAALFLWVAAPMEPRLVSYKADANLLVRFTIRSFVFMGVISYSLYLIHGKIYGLSAMFARQAFPQESIFYLIVTILGTILLSAVFYKYLEKPFQSNQLRKRTVDALKLKSKKRGF